jgi:hypothetical protein
MEGSNHEHCEANANDVHSKYGAHVLNQHVLSESQVSTLLPSFSQRSGLFLSESDVLKLFVDILRLDYQTLDHIDLIDRCFTPS